MYDPVKAHEYYMAHRKLKGRHSTKGFSDTQKEQWAYTKHELGEERKNRNATNREAINATRQARLKQLSDAASTQIESLKSQLKNMNKYQRKAAKSRIQNAIASIRNILKGDKSEVRASAKAQKSAAMDLSTERYNNDLDAAYEEIKKSGKKR